MNELSHQGILNRDEVIGQINKHFSDQINLLKDLVNYGTNLIPRCFYCSDRKLSDTVILSILLIFTKLYAVCNS